MSIFYKENHRVVVNICQKKVSNDEYYQIEVKLVELNVMNEQVAYFRYISKKKVRERNIFRFGLLNFFREQDLLFGCFYLKQEIQNKQWLSISKKKFDDQ